MANVIDSLLITMGLDGSGVKRGMAEIEGSLSSGVKNITTNILAPLAGAFAFGALLHNFTDTADALGKLSASLDVDIRDLDAWGQAAQHAGGSASGFQSSIVALNERLQRFVATGEGQAKKVFEALGIAAKDASGNAKTAVEVLHDLAGAAEGMDKAKFAGLAKKLGLDQGTIQLLQSGNKEVDALVTRMKDLAYTQRDAEIAAEFKDIMQDLNKTFQAGAAIFMRLLVPALTYLASQATRVVNFLREHEAFVLIFFTTLAAIIAARLTPAILAMSKAWLANPLTLIIGLVVALALALDDLWSFVRGGSSAIEGLMRTFGATDATIESVRSGARNLLDVLAKYGPALGIVTVAIKGVTLAMRLMGVAALSNPALAVLFSIAAAATYVISNWEDVVTFFSSLGERIKTALAGVKEFLLDLVPDWLRGLLDGNAGGGLLDSASSFFSGLFGGDASGSVSPALAAAGPVDNSVIEYNQSVTVNATSTDPAGIARETGAELRRMTAAGNKGVRQ